MRTRVLDDGAVLTESSRVRKILTELPAGEGATCPLCAQFAEGAVMVDAHDMRRVGLLSLFEEPSDGASVTFAPCGCRWDSDEDEARMFVVTSCGEALGFALVDVDDDAPGLARGRGR